jgi:hypothetical protein
VLSFVKLCVTSIHSINEYTIKRMKDQCYHPRLRERDFRERWGLVIDDDSGHGSVPLSQARILLS